MNIKSNTTLSNLVILATLSTSVLNVSYELNDLTPSKDVEYEYTYSVSDWKDEAFNDSSDYRFVEVETNKLETMIEFTKNLLDNSTDLDSEYIEIVNENFWELI